MDLFTLGTIWIAPHKNRVDFVSITGIIGQCHAKKEQRLMRYNVSILQIRINCCQKLLEGVLELGIASP